MRHSVTLWILSACLITGCASRRSSLLLERQAVGPLEQEPGVAKVFDWHLQPDTQTQTKGDVEVTVRHTSHDWLNEFFKNKEIFGSFAGANPYRLEHLVFYVKVSNHSKNKIRIAPGDFVVVDDLGNQYPSISIGHVTALAEYKAPVASVTRGVLSEAKPGYFGLSVPIGKFLGAPPQGPFALLMQSGLESGFLYPGVVHDGLVAFWSPSLRATKLRLIVTNVKTNFDANDWPQASLEFPFDFDATSGKH